MCGEWRNGVGKNHPWLYGMSVFLLCHGAMILLFFLCFSPNFLSHSILLLLLHSAPLLTHNSPIFLYFIDHHHTLHFSALLCWPTWPHSIHEMYLTYDTYWCYWNVSHQHVSHNTALPGFHMYSDSKNWFTFGKFFHVRSIVAQGTKAKSWENQITKQSILSLFVPSFKPLASFIDLIQDLQWPTLNEPVFVLSLGLSLFGLYYCLCPSGHALNQVSTTSFVLSDPTFTYSKAHVHHQEGPHKHWTLAWGIATDTQ